jgi:hypothetical protein
MKMTDTPRCAAMKSGEDHELCVLDLGFLGLTGPQALSQLLAMDAGLPILVGRGCRFDAEAGAAGVRRIVRRSHSLEAFRRTIGRLRQTGASLYLKLEF